jgi:hypothetical protein
MIPGSWFFTPVGDGLWHWRNHGVCNAACKKLDTRDNGKPFLPREVETTKVCPICLREFDRALEKSIPRIEKYIESYKWNVLCMRQRRTREPG